ncbi:hypothetical protein [Bradyrhizobium sp. USDA 4518]
MKLLPPPLGISGILYRLSVFGNSAWEILYNDPDERFSRRDRSLRQVGIVDRILPPAPDLAIRILPDVTRARAKPDLTSPAFDTGGRALREGMYRRLIASSCDAPTSSFTVTRMPESQASSRKTGAAASSASRPECHMIMNITTHFVVAAG